MSFFSSITKDREYGFKNPQEQLQYAHFCPTQAKKLKLDKALKGHALCVNRLAWNSDGSMLVSGSDDRRVLLWKYPDVDALPMALRTWHMCNIFAVHFLPCTNNRIVVSAGMDNTVQMHQLDADPGNVLKYPCRLQEPQPRVFPEAVEVQPSTTVFSCHESTVKAMAVEPMNPNNFWSASEDGTVREFDVRCPNMDSEDALNVLITLRNGSGRLEEIKGIDINQVRPHQMALASGDPYIRIYDRRKLSLGGVSNTSPEPVLMLAPPQLSVARQKGRERSCYISHVSFGSMGDKVVGTYHAEHAYSFDVTGEGVVSSTFRRPFTSSGEQVQEWVTEGAEKEGPKTNTQQKHRFESESNITHHPAAVQHITKGNICMDSQQFNQAVECFIAAIYYSPYSWDLYVERAKALLERNYAGDSCFALRDCDQAILLNRRSDEAHFFKIKSLIAMSEWKAADELHVQFAIDFPVAASSDLFKQVVRELHEQMPSGKTQELLEEEGQDGSSSCGMPLSQVANMWRDTTGGRRLLSRFLGHCNMQTDIKESVFLGQNDDLVACGSDGGAVFIYEAATGKIVQVINGAEHVANCVQAHPSRTTLATSGMGSDINIWGPSGDPCGIGEETFQLVDHNQHQIKCGSCSFSSEISDAHMQFLLNSYELVELFLGH